MKTNQIPIELTNFIGRERDLEKTAEYLHSHRLVTLTGTGGCGKTRLAIRLATRIQDNFADGVHWIGLASLSDGIFLVQTITKALRLPQVSGRASGESLIEALKSKQLLLVLDNCEHLLDPCRKLVSRLLTGTDVKILTTSREALQITGEKIYPVQPMAVPSEDGSEIGQFDAVQLFVERAQTIVPTFELTARNAAAIVRICRLMDGIPLALELAAARTNILSVEQIADRLQRRDRILPDATHITDSPHAGMDATIDWSYDLLSTKERVMFRRLSVFQGGCSISTVEGICTGDGIEHEEVLDLLSSLVNKSLLVARTLQQGEARYRLLKIIRQYAQEKLIASGEFSTLQNRHLQYYLDLAEATESNLKGNYQELWLNWLESDYNNIRSALTRAKDVYDKEAGLRICNAIFLFWIVRGYTEEGLGWLAQFLAMEGENVSPNIYANALAFASFLAGFSGKAASQAAYADEALARAEKLGRDGQTALAWTHAGTAYAQGRPGPLPSGGSARVWTLVAQAFGARAVGDYESEFMIYKQIIRLQRESGNQNDLGMGLITGGSAAMSLGRYEEARKMVDEALPLLREAGNLYSIALSLNGSGDLARCQQNYKLAQAHYKESITLLRELGAMRDLASSMHNLAHTYVHLGEIEPAFALLNESTNLQQELSNVPGIGECLIGFAAIASVSDMPAQSIRLLSAAVAIGGEEITKTWPATIMEYDHYLAHARNQVSEMVFDEEQAAGRNMNIEQAVVYALDVAEKALRTRQSTRMVNELTPRELEVAILIGQALSNAEIAEKLVLSKRTVESHIANIRSKLHFTKRAQIVQWVIANGLVERGE